MTCSCRLLTPLILLAALSAAPARAQFVPSDVQAADITLARYQTMLSTYGSMSAALRRIAAQKALPERTLAEVARRLQVKSPQLSPAEILAALDRQSDDLVALRQRLSEIDGGDSPRIAALRRQSAAAFDGLRFEEAEQLIGQVVELRRAAILARHAAQDAANDQAQAELVKDLVAQARIAGSRSDSDRQINLLLDALKEAPAKRPAIASYVKGMLSYDYYLKGLRQHDLSAARSALETLRSVKDEGQRGFNFTLADGEADDLILIAELEPTRANLSEAVDKSRALYRSCMATKASSGAVAPDYSKLDLGECLVSTGAPGIATARDLLIRSTMLLGQIWNDETALAEAEPLLNEAISDPRIQAMPAQLALARMRLGIILSMRAGRTADVALHDRAISILDASLATPTVAQLPDLATLIRVNLAAALVARGRYADGIAMADRALQGLDKSQDQSTWINLQVTRATAHTRLAQSASDDHHLEYALTAYRAIVSADPPLTPPVRLAFLRIALAELDVTSFARSGSTRNLEEAQQQLDAAKGALDCTSPSSIRANLAIAQGDLLYQRAVHSQGRFAMLATATVYEQAMVTADRAREPQLWAHAARFYAETMGYASWDEEQGAFDFVPDSIGAFDEAIAEYRAIGDLDLATEATATEVDVFVALSKGYKDKHRRRAVLDRASLAAHQLEDLGGQTKSPRTIAAAQQALVHIDKIRTDAKLDHVRPAPFGHKSSPATPACEKPSD